MKPKKIFLVRHGESEGNVNKKIYCTTPDWKVDLTWLGQKEAEDAAKELHAKIDGALAIYSSPWTRAIETAEHFKTSSSHVIVQDPRLREQEWGNYQEDHLEQKIRNERKKYGSFFYRIPYGESGADVYDRVSTFLETLHRDFKKEWFPPNVLIVSHGLTIKAFLMRWFHFPVEWFDKIDTPENCQLIEMELQADGKYLLKTELKEDEEYASI